MVGCDSSQVRPVGSKIGQALRSHGGSDPGLARWCVNQLGAIAGLPAVWSPLRSVRPANDTFEIWFDRSSAPTRSAYVLFSLIKRPKRIGASRGIKIRRSP